MAEPQSLEVLMTYTTFHTGVYVSLTTVFIEADALKKINHWTMRFAVACFVLAGIRGGIIAANAAEYTSPVPEFFTKPVLWLWFLGSLEVPAVRDARARRLLGGTSADCCDLHPLWWR